MELNPFYRPVHYKTEKNEDKLKIVEAAKEMGNSACARLYNVKRQNIIRWRNQEEELKKSVGNKKGKRTSIGHKNSKVVHCEMELILDSWIRDARI